MSQAGVVHAHQEAGLRSLGPPGSPKIYHITHVDNLGSIVADGCVWSERRVSEKQLSSTCVGMDQIKQRRLDEIEVTCHPGTNVGDYTPFYFCPRSVMLYLLSRANHPKLAYRGGQDPIVHLQADLRTVVDWADGIGVRWAFTRSNAGAYYVDFHNGLEDLGSIDWRAIQATDWRDPATKEGKQAEFLLYEQLPFDLVERIGVMTSRVRSSVEAVLAASRHQPVVAVEREWYY